MPPKRRPQEESSSEDEGGMESNLAKFTNVNFSQSVFAELPKEVADRTRALLAIEEDQRKRAEAIAVAKRALDRKYAALYAPLFARRREIVNGAGNAVSETEIKAGMPEDHVGKVAVDAVGTETTGLENFWLRALQHHCIIEDMITERDAEVLKHLRDIEVVHNSEEEGQGFTLKFVFAENDFFEGTELTKQFLLRDEDGQSVIAGTKESTVTWKSDEKNVTITLTTKKQKSKSKAGATRFVTAKEECESFFRLFDTTEDPEDAEQWYSLGETLRTKIVPLAPEYYTGEAPDGSSDVDEDEDEEDEDDEDEDDESDDDVPPPRGGRGAGGRGPAPKPGGKQECKQQ